MATSSETFAPSKQTVYVSNFPFSLTNSDLHTLMEKYGKIAKVTIVRDRQTRESKGVAFVLFSKRDDAMKAVNDLNEKEVFGRTIKCSIAKDNGRATEFIQKKVYEDKTRCYECGEFGHLSYKCPKNVLGERDIPQKKTKKKKKRKNDEKSEKSNADEELNEEEEEQFEDESLASVIRSDVRASEAPTISLNPRKKIKKSDYFSDEEEIDDDETA